MNLLTHTIAERLVDDLMLRDFAFAGERGANDDGFEMLSVAGDFQMRAVETFLDVTFNVFGSNHDVAISNV